MTGKTGLAWMGVLSIAIGSSLSLLPDKLALAAGTFPATRIDGHRVDGDKVDAYARVTVNPDGSWKADEIHTNNTGGNKLRGGCNRVTLHFYNRADQELYHFEVGVFCTQPPFAADRKDFPAAPPGTIPAAVLKNTAKFAVVVSDGENRGAWSQLAGGGDAIAQFL